MSNEIEDKKVNSKKIVIDTDFVDKSDDIKIISKKSKKDKEVNIGGIVILVVILSFVSGFLGAYLVVGNGNSGTINNGDGVITSIAKLDETNSISKAVEKIYDAVVVVEVYEKEKLVSTGTGFVYKKDGKKAYLMTNNHVITEEGKVKVLFTNGNEVDADVVGSDVYSDIAVLSIDDSKEIVSSVLGKSEVSKIGDTVFAVGSPEGSDYAGTVTKGIISGKNRVVEVALSSTNSIDYYMEVLQTDAAINPGNSGGPICNISGEVIGITNMKLVDDTVEGMGFAIPIEDALKVAEILEKNGEVVRPYVGIEMLDISNQFNLWQAGIMLPEGIDKGVVVYKVLSDSPADKANLKKGDIIIELGGKKIDGLAEFRYQLYKHNPGDEVEVVYVRDGETEKTTIILGEGE